MKSYASVFINCIVYTRILDVKMVFFNLPSLFLAESYYVLKILHIKVYSLQIHWRHATPLIYHVWPSSQGMLAVVIYHMKVAGSRR